jgi:hypothetical protein
MQSESLAMKPALMGWSPLLAICCCIALGGAAANGLDDLQLDVTLAPSIAAHDLELEIALASLPYSAQLPDDKPAAPPRNAILTFPTSSPSPVVARPKAARPTREKDKRSAQIPRNQVPKVSGRELAKKVLPEKVPPHSKDLPPLSKRQQQLRAKIRRTLTHYFTYRPLNTRDHGPWELMHWMLAYEVHSQVRQGSPRGKPITTVGWLCFNQPARKRTMLYLNKEDQMRVRVAPALQGHTGQLLSILAQSSVSKEYPIRINDHDYTVADLIEMEKETCYPRTELTFKLISLVHYLDLEAEWVNDQGMKWSIPRMLREEMAQPIRSAACGGTHRLNGYTLAYKKRLKKGQPLDGEYLQAKKIVDSYRQHAYRMQNPDGSFSTEWFRGRGAEKDIERRLKTTGHTLEWLLYAATEKEVKSRRIESASNYLATLLYNNRSMEWDNGILGHGLHALLLYDRLVFGRYDPWQNTRLASRGRKK